MATNKDFIVQSGIQIKGTANATNTYSGALQVAGGAGIAGDLWVGGSIFMDGKGIDNVNASTGTFLNVYVTGTNVSNSTSTGALTVTGGVGIGGALYASEIYDTGARVLTTATVGDFGVANLSVGTDTAVSTSTGQVVIWNISTLQSVTNRGAVTTNAITINNSTISTGSTTGALTVAGGVGIGDTLNVSRQLTVADNWGYNTLTNTIAYFGANTSTYAQVNLQNIGGGTSSSVDYVVTSNNGNDEINFADFGINNSSFNDPLFTIAGANDAYLYAQGGNLAIGTSVENKDIVFFQGDTLAANEVGRWVYGVGFKIVTGTENTLGNTATGALQVGGGAGIAGNLTVGGSTNLQATTATTLGLSGKLTALSDADIAGNVKITSTTQSTGTSTGALIVTGGVAVGQQLSAGTIYTQDTTQATQAGAGSVRTAGGVYIGENLVVNGAGSSTGTTATNALIVNGGAYVGNNLTVSGPALFKDVVTFAGTATYIFSTNTYYTDNLIELHVPPGGINDYWTVSDGKDIGIRYHYFNTDLNTGTNAALVLSADENMLEFYGSGVESTTSTFGASYGGFKTGYIYLNSGTNSTSAASGALQVAGGIGVGADIWVTGKGTFNSTEDTTGAGTGGLITLGGLGISKAVYVGTTATIAGAGASTSAVAGNALQVTTGGLGVASSGYFGGALKVASTTAASSTNSGALQVVGGIGVGGALYAGGIINTADATDSALVNPGLSGALQVAGGAGVAKNLSVGGTISRTGSLSQASWQGATGIALNLPAATYTDTTSAGSVAGPNAAAWLGQPTLAASNSVTYTDAATLYILDAPAAGTNVTLSNSYALLVANGVVRIKSTTASSNTTTGALVVDGGLGVGGNLYATALYDNGSRVLTAATIGSYGVSQIIASTGTSISPTAGTGTVTIWSSDTLQTLTNRGATTNNAISITNTTLGSSTNTGQALLVSGGIGAQAVYAGQLYDSGNRVITDVSATGSTGLTVTTSTNGTSISFALANTGVTSIAGTANQIVASNSTGAVTLSFPAGGITSTTGTFTSNVFLTNTAIATGPSTGALQIAGGASVNANLYVGTTATVAGTLFRTGDISRTGWLAGGVSIVASTATFTDTSLTGAQGLVAVNALGKPTIAASNTPTYSDAATLYIADAPTAATGATITNPWSLYVSNGNVKINSATVSNGTNVGALVVTGGVGIGGNLNVGGSATFASTGILVGNSLISSYTSGSISTTSTQNLDTFTTSTYRTARYTVQVVDGTKVHISEMTVFHDNTVVYKNEYGISYNTTELGTFDATLVGSTITLTFTPNYTPAAMVIKATRTAITA